jgi:spermidine synthase
MQTLPVVALLVYDLIILGGAVKRLGPSRQRWEMLLVIGLFLCSGMPALIYQVVWQRALFSVYGVNAESVAVVVSAFMLGLGLGSLAGGWISSRFPRRGIAIFGIAELGTAAFGLCSLRIFHWAAARTAGANLPATIVFTLALLILPTMLMGATLPILVERLVRDSGRVGYSVAMLYSVNTFGSAVACYLCATFLLNDFGQSGSVAIAAGMNILVGSTAFLYGRSGRAVSKEIATPPQESRSAAGGLPLGLAMLVAGVSGFIGLGFEIAWFRVFLISSSDRAPAFALLLSTFLAGIAAGSYIAEKLTEKKSSATVVQVVGVVMLFAGVISVYLPPLVGFFRRTGVNFLMSASGFFVAAALMGSVLPLLCRLSITNDDQAGRRVSLVYVSNIVGSALGTLLVGFVVMQYFGLREVSLQLGISAVIAGSAILSVRDGKFRTPPAWAAVAIAVALVAVPAASPLYSELYEKLIWGTQFQGNEPFTYIVENRNGVIAVTGDSMVFGDGVYDGYFNTDPTHDVNLIVRAFALSAFHPAPRRMLMIGLSSGSWGQILVNQPQAESLDVVEINPGYLTLISRYAMVRSLLQNPKVQIHIDDGRRWMLAHPGERYDAIVENTSFYWRDHSSNLLSTDYLEIIRKHLKPGGVFYYNTTGSDDVLATGLHVFPYGLRVLNFLAVSDSPLQMNMERWMNMLQQYRIDNHLVFDPDRPKSTSTLGTYKDLFLSLQEPPKDMGMESSGSLNARLGHRLIITDNNMGWEWRSQSEVPYPLHY